MAISVVGTASSNSAGASVSSLAVTLPGGTAQNDVVYVLGCMQRTSDRDMQESGGTYTELADLYSNDLRDVNFGLFRKVQGATPDSTVTIKESTGANPARFVDVAYVVRGEDTTTPEDATTTTATGTDGGRPDCPSITTATANALVVAFGGSGDAITATNAPTGYSNLIADNTTDGGTNTIAAVASSKTISSPGAENPAAYTDYSTNVAYSWCAATIAIKPAASASAAISRARNFSEFGQRVFA